MTINEGNARRLLLTVYGLVIGMLVGSQLGIDAEQWTPLAAGIRDLATALGIGVGGAWAYAKFLRSRESEARINLTHEVTSVELASVLLLRVILEIKNIGPVAVLPPTGFMLVQLPPSQPGSANGDPQKAWALSTELSTHFSTTIFASSPAILPDTLAM